MGVISISNANETIACGLSFHPCIGENMRSLKLIYLNIRPTHIDLDVDAFLNTSYMHFTLK